MDGLTIVEDKTDFRALNIAATNDNVVAIGKKDQQPYRYNKAENSWEQIASGSKGDAIAVGTDGEIYTQTI